MIEKIKWDESFSVGVLKLDQQHMRILAIINLLVDQQEQEFNSRVIAKILADLTNYAHEHFGMEEQLLAEHGYPDIRTQREEHHEFRKKLAHFCDEAIIRDKLVPTQLFEYLKNWWVDHILEKDMKYRSFLKDRGMT